MAVQSISATLVANLKATGKPEAIALAGRFEKHQISEKNFIDQAGRFARQYSGDSSGALTRSVRLHAAPPPSYDPHLVALSRDVERTGVAARERDVDFRDMERILS